MSEAFEIACDWHVPERGPDEIRWTTAQVRVNISGQLVTLVEDERSKSVRDTVTLSAYPLALWLASSWWRLTSESLPHPVPPIGWRMAHETASVGGGYLWPRLGFTGDGETIRVTCRQSRPIPSEPIRYLNEFEARLTLEQFELGAMAFIETVMSRLDTRGLTATALHSLWQEVCEERSNSVLRQYRILEARLGYDPDEAPEELMERWLALTDSAGTAATYEAASAGVGSPEELLALAGSYGVVGTLPETGWSVDRELEPWMRGYKLAERARSEWVGITDPVSNEVLADILSMPIDDLKPSSGLTSAAANLFTLAVKDRQSQNVTIHFRRHHPQARRFEAARILADGLIAPAEDRWLPATEAKTARQKVQRAFATEFLCPITSLRDYLGSDLSDEAIGEAGEYYGVSSVAIRNQLINHHMLGSQPHTP